MALHPEPFKPWLNHFPWMVEDDAVKTFAIALFAKVSDKWKFFTLVKANWQYTNAVVSVRTNLSFIVWIALHIAFYKLVSGWYLLLYFLLLYPTICLFGNWPFAWFMHVRWSDDPAKENQYLQYGFGWKESGRFAIHFRIQCDKTAADGYHVGMPNRGQAQGFNYGGK